MPLLLSRNTILDDQHQAPVNMLLPTHSSKLFTRNPVLCFLEVDKARLDVFGVFQDFSKICWRAKVLSVVLQPGHKMHWLAHSFGSIFRGIFFQDTKHSMFPREANERYAPVVSAFSPVSRFAYGNDHSSFPNNRCHCRTPGNLTHTSQPKNSLSIQGFEHFRSDFIIASSKESIPYEAWLQCKVDSSLHSRYAWVRKYASLTLKKSKMQ